MSYNGTWVGSYSWPSWLFCSHCVPLYNPLSVKENRDGRNRVVSCMYKNKHENP
jgi:hypothetical protein